MLTHSSSPPRRNASQPHAAILRLADTPMTMFAQAAYPVIADTQTTGTDEAGNGARATEPVAAPVRHSSRPRGSS